MLTLKKFMKKNIMENNAFLCNEWMTKFTIDSNNCYVMLHERSPNTMEKKKYIKSFDINRKHKIVLYKN